MNPGHKLPTLAHWVIDHFAPPEWRESISGDLAEEQRRRALSGQPAGAGWAVRSALWTCARLAAGRRRGFRSAQPAGAIRTGLTLDLRQTVRALSVERGYAMTAVLTLALGIGATTAVFSLSNALLLRPIPGAVDPAHLVTIYFGSGAGTGLMSLRTVDALAEAAPAIQHVAGTGEAAANLALGGLARRVHLEVVTGNYFEVLGNPIGLGRGFTSDEGRNPTAAPVAILSDALWRQSFNASTAVLGAPVTINGDRWTIVGVTVPGFEGPSRTGRTDAWVPVAQYARVLPGYRDVLTSATARVFGSLIGRLAPGAMAEGLSSQAEVVRTRLAAERPRDFQLTHWHFLVRRGVVDRDWVREQLGGSMALLAGLVALLLALAAANTANLMLMRALGRRAELATHAALGASRPRLIRLLLLESVVLAAGGGLLALGLCAASSHVMAGTVVLSNLPPIDPPPMDWRVFGFAVALSASVAIAAGVLPALTGSRVQLLPTLRGVDRLQTGRRGRLRQCMAIVQLALSLILLLGALLLARSMAMRRSIDPGFDPARVLAFSVEPRLERYEPTRMMAFYQSLLSRLRVLPGVRAAGIASLEPLSNYAGDEAVRADGQPEDAAVSAEFNAVSSGFFDSLGLPFVAGHDFTDADLLQPDAPDAPVIISASLARRLFGRSLPIGRRVILKYQGGGMRLVAGVVADMRQRQFLAPPADMVFEPLSEGFAAWSSVLVGLSRRTDAPAIASAAERVVASIDSAMPIYDVGTLNLKVDRQLSADRLLTALSALFAALATALAAVGFYGVLARGVAERRREFGIRLALGARPLLVARLVARDALVVVITGTALGLGVSALLVRLIESRLFEISPWDPLAGVGAVVLLTLVAVVATQPAVHRATHVDPVQALRE